MLPHLIWQYSRDGLEMQVGGDSTSLYSCQVPTDSYTDDKGQREKQNYTPLFHPLKNNSESGSLWSKETYSQSEQSTTIMGSEVTWKRALSIIYNEAFRHKVHPGLLAQLQC